MTDQNIMTARDAILRELEIAEGRVKVASDAYAKDQSALQEAQRRVTASYDTRAHYTRERDRLKKALAIIEGEGDD